MLETKEVAIVRPEFAAEVPRSLGAARLKMDQRHAILNRSEHHRHGPSIANRQTANSIKLANMQRAAAAAPPTGQHLYAYCHVKTNQVLYSLSRNLNVSSNRAIDFPRSHLTDCTELPLEATTRRRRKLHTSETTKRSLAAALRRQPSTHRRWTTTESRHDAKASRVPNATRTILGTFGRDEPADVTEEN